MLALTAEEKGGTEDPIEMERLAEGAIDRAHNRFIVFDDPDEVVERIGWYVNLGFSELIFHLPADDQNRQINAFAADVPPPPPTLELTRRGRFDGYLVTSTYRHPPAGPLR